MLPGKRILLDSNEIISRNIGLITEDDQKKISNSVIGIAGAGSDGGLAAERIVRMGVKGIKLADPEVFDTSNINRQYGASFSTIGKNKCQVVMDELKKIRSDLEFSTFPEGINQTNADSFVDNCNIILDEIEYTLPKASIYLHKAARKKNLIVFAGLNLGFGINIFKFIPNGLAFEKLINFNENQAEENFRMESLVPNIPEYVSKDVVEKVLRRETFVPSVSPTVGLLSGYLSYLVMGELIKKWTIPPAPKFLHVDMFTSCIEIKELSK